MEVIERYKLHEAFRERFAQGTIFAGTSAGTAIMSQKMLTGRGVETSQGLGLLPAHYIVDQHFLVRNRWQRLADVVLTHQLTGIGIDEDNALFIKNESAEVIGPTAVQLLRIQDRTIETSSFKNGETFSLK
ncbi:MAG: Type 1 glutamine amidotransferase-like domain-containing protein [Proteobacteria bacterium]|jgi:cyanophycinase|nr:Type 1 glutamine amidotransferase-like domain-containing protein [Pseudomonadota bacterium]